MFPRRLHKIFRTCDESSFARVAGNVFNLSFSCQCNRLTQDGFGHFVDLVLTNKHQQPDGCVRQNTFAALGHFARRTISFAVW